MWEEVVTRRLIVNIFFKKDLKKVKDFAKYSLGEEHVRQSKQLEQRP